MDEKATFQRTLCGGIDDVTGMERQEDEDGCATARSELDAAAAADAGAIKAVASVAVGDGRRGGHRGVGAAGSASAPAHLSCMRSRHERGLRGTPQFVASRVGDLVRMAS